MRSSPTTLYMGIHKREASIWRGRIAICTVAPLGTGSPSQAQWSGGREGWRRGGRGEWRKDGRWWGLRRVWQADQAGWMCVRREKSRRSRMECSPGAAGWFCRLAVCEPTRLEDGAQRPSLAAQIWGCQLSAGQFDFISQIFVINCCNNFHINQVTIVVKY